MDKISILRFGLAWLVLNLFALAPAEEGFQPLYNEGDPLEQGWKMVGPGAVVEESPGVLKTEGGMGMLWYAERPFKDFVLRLEYQVARPRDNSGVFVRFPNPPESPWDAVNQGYEIQICDSESPEHRTGAIYSFKGPDKDPPTRSPGEWNNYEIAVEGQKYTIKLNGETINTFEGSRGESGYIGLQNHDDRSIVRFRNIQIKPLED
ncbi:hypothetical protein BH23PLA1_BH23PLA1_41340 [soil metagenome]